MRISREDRKVQPAGIDPGLRLYYSLAMLKLLRDRSGRLYELNILFAFLVLAALIGAAHRSALKGLAYAALWLLGLFAVIMLFMVLENGADALREDPRVKRLLATPAGRLLKPAAWGAFGAALGAATAAFASIFLAPALADSPEGRLLAMRALTAAGGLLAGALGFTAARRADAPI